MSKDTTSSHNSTKPVVVGIPHRTIKFRLWDNLQNEMFFEGFNVFGEVTMFNAIGTYAYETKGERSSLERYNDFIIMQFTGLKDGNKDIYEGDCLKNKNYSGVVVFTDGCFCLEIKKQHEKDLAPFTFSYDAGQIIPLYNFENLSIIGNVFQNPELLG